MKFLELSDTSMDARVKRGLGRIANVLTAGFCVWAWFANWNEVGRLRGLEAQKEAALDFGLMFLVFCFFYLLFSVVMVSVLRWVIKGFVD